MLGPGDVLLGRLKARRGGPGLPFRLRAQQREVEAGHVDLAHLVPGIRRALRVGMRQAVAEAVRVRVGMALYQEDAGHGQSEGGKVNGLRWWWPPAKPH